jgi:sulfur transfer complex TusBCD TusB component (DsrH family)
MRGTIRAAGGRIDALAGERAASKEATMAGYVFIAARDPWDGPEHEQVFELAGSLAAERDSVSIYLTDNGVLAARAGDGERWLGPLLSAGVSVFADPFALAERGIAHERMVHGVVPAALEQLVDLLAKARPALWF